MIFTDWLYGFFLLVAVIGFWSLPLAARSWWLVGAGMVFYACYHPPHLLLVVALTALVYGAARAGRRRVALVTAGIVVSLGTLAYYKYAGFFLSVLARAGVPAPAAAASLVPERVPLAISFFVFEFVHYLIEVRRGTITPGRPRDFVLFIFFFPTLVSGPIKRFGEFEPQIGRTARLDSDLVNRGLERIVFGLAKKLLVADTIHECIAPIWAAPLAEPRGVLWLATYGYALQILFDFSGYSDIAIGSALLLGFRVPENFAYPYLQPNLAGFWRSWHMSLTSWITDYVYIPLGGNRRGPVRTQVNRMVAMGLVGLWHGAAGHFVCWGLFHGVGLNAYHLYRAVRTRLPLRADFGLAGQVIATFLTFHFVCLGWVLFVVDTATAGKVIARLVGLG